jgi:hypothetical protein
MLTVPFLDQQMSYVESFQFQAELDHLTLDLRPAGKVLADFGHLSLAFPENRAQLLVQIILAGHQQYRDE